MHKIDKLIVGAALGLAVTLTTLHIYQTSNSFRLQVAKECTETYQRIMSIPNGSWNALSGNNTIVPTIGQCHDYK